MTYILIVFYGSHRVLNNVLTRDKVSCPMRLTTCAPVFSPVKVLQTFEFLSGTKFFFLLVYSCRFLAFAFFESLSDKTKQLTSIISLFS
jgi:hypothetical protein